MDEDKKNKKKNNKRNKNKKNTSIQKHTLDSTSNVPDNDDDDATSLKDQHFQNQNNEFTHKLTTLEQINKQLQDENQAHLQKEAILQEKIDGLMDDVADLNLKAQASLQDIIKQMEGEKEDFILRENSARESLTSQKNENIKLRAQVQVLEQSNKSFLLEKQQLQENISSLQLEINNIERTVSSSPFPSIVNNLPAKDGDGENQIEASCVLVEKLRDKNSKLVEKVNELHMKRDLIGVRTEYSLPTGSAIEAVGTRSTYIADNSALPPALAVGDDDNKIEAADTITEVSKMTMPLSSSDLSLKDIMIEDERNSGHLNDKSAFRVANTSEIIEEVDEIVQIPLDERQVTETNLKGKELEENSGIPLTDAPLIGAPFRLISFVARYVSGADLVK